MNYQQQFWQLYWSTNGFVAWEPGKLAIPPNDYSPSFELAAREAACIANKAIEEMMR